MKELRFCLQVVFWALVLTFLMSWEKLPGQVQICTPRTVGEEKDLSDIVFAGTVKKVSYVGDRANTAEHRIIVTIEPLTLYKGEVGQGHVVVLYTYDSPRRDSYKIGENYFVYAKVWKARNWLLTDLSDQPKPVGPGVPKPDDLVLVVGGDSCNRTKRLVDAREDIAKINLLKEVAQK